LSPKGSAARRLTPSAGRSLALDADDDASRLVRWSEAEREEKKACAPDRFGWISQRRLSFLNLVEARVLASIRLVHNASLLKVREALDYVKSDFKIDCPLLA
jgi:hypothetical protein